jgi:drug/metabolite transporter (DMT)-like permease
MVSGGLVLGAMGLLSGEVGHFDIGAVSRDSFLALLYLTIIGSLLAFTAYGWLLRIAPLPLVATYAYVNPIVAVILGAIVRGEPIEPRTVLAGSVIVFAVALIVTARGRMAAPRTEPDPPASVDVAQRPDDRSAQPSAGASPVRPG